MVKTRFAPSPTGNLHIGGARTAIVSWLIAQKLNGQFVLRIEDTDVERSKPEYTESIMNSLSWLGIYHDEGPYYQMQRLQRYQEVAKQLVKDGKAYYCYCTPEELQAKREAYKEKTGHDGWKYDRKWRNLPAPAHTDIKPVIRLKVPLDGLVHWNDLTKGGINIPNAQLDDFIIMRSDGIPTYNFCVVVDDMDMGISHVIRGDDHINNTPKQIHIYNALDAKVPTFGHIPLILNMDGSKQSKRDNVNEVNDNGQLKPMTNLNYYKDNGILPEAIVNYLLLISCNDVGKEVFSKEEFVNLFDLNKLGATPIKFDLEKLIWLNQQHIKNMTTYSFIETLTEELQKNNVDLSQWIGYDFAIFEQGIKERSKLIKDFYPLIAPVLSWNPEGFSDNLMQQVLNSLVSLQDWNITTVHDAIKEVADSNQLKFGQVVKPLREQVFTTSKLPLAEMIVFLGQDNFKAIQKKTTLKP